MKGDKYCELCGAYIGNMETWGKGYYSFIRTKYCDRCRDDMKRRHEKERSKKYRKRSKQISEEETAQLDLLKKENELLRKNIIKLREELEGKKISEHQTPNKVTVKIKKHPHGKSGC